MDNMGISVIICCYNSALRLPETIKHIATQKCSENINLEVIVVDNASKDNTGLVAKEEWNKYNTGSIDFKVVNQPIPGLSNARIKGVECSSHDLLLFCDDDNWLHQNYILIAIEVMKNNHNIGALGGQGIAVSDILFPEWWEDYKGYYAVGKQAEQSKIVNDRGFIWGAGIITRKNIYLKCFSEKYPSLLVGRNNEILSAGDDAEYCLRLLLMGYNLFYDERLIFNHFITSGRLDFKYRDGIVKGIHKADEILRIYELVYKLKQLTKSKSVLYSLNIFFSFIKNAIMFKFKFSKRRFSELLLILNFKIFIDKNDYEVLQLAKSISKEDINKN